MASEVFCFEGELIFIQGEGGCLILAGRGYKVTIRVCSGVIPKEGFAGCMLGLPISIRSIFVVPSSQSRVMGCWVQFLSAQVSSFGV